MAKELIVAVFDSVELAGKACHDFNALSEKAEGFHLESCMLVQKDDAGHVRILSDETRFFWGKAIGSVTGSLVGMLGGPVGAAAGLAIGAGVGAAIDAKRDASLRQDFTQVVSDGFPARTVALIAEAEELTPFSIDNIVLGFQGKVFRKELS